MQSHFRYFDGYRSVLCLGALTVTSCIMIWAQIIIRYPCHFRGMSHSVPNFAALVNMNGLNVNLFNHDPKK